MRSVMYYKGMRTTIQRYVKTCQSCQVNKRHSQKYGHLPPQLVITTPWKALYVDLIGPYTLKGKDGSSIDFMCLTMIDPATSWFKIVELPTVTQEMTVPPVGKGKKVTFDNNTKVAEPYFDKSSAQISNQVYKTWFSRYLQLQQAPKELPESSQRAYSFQANCSSLEFLANVFC